MKVQIGPILLLLMIISYGCSSPNQNKKEEGEENVEAEAPIKRSAFFVSPAEGDTVSTTFSVVMGVEGMEVEPAGEVKEGFGHHHILINQMMWPEGEIIPPSDTTIHYGKGQKETELTLEPGNYTISLQFADGVHRSYGEEMAASINITVQE